MKLPRPCVQTFLVVCCLSLALHSPQLWAQSQSDRPAFEVASVKVNKSGDLRMGSSGDDPGPRFTATNWPLRLLFVNAYHLSGVQMQQVSGWPSWVDSERFDIEARAEGNPTREQKQLMLQSLLADRFKLVMHNETRQLPVYALVLVKPEKLGPQLIPHSDDTKCLDLAKPAAPEPPAPNADALPPPPCGGMTNLRPSAFPALIAPRSVTSVGNLTMKEFALELGVGRVVVDRTGLSGTFDLTLKYSPEIGQAGFQPGADASAPDPSAPPSIFIALQEQLGLKLEPTTGPVDVLVIDHVEEPSPN